MAKCRKCGKEPSIYSLNFDKSPSGWFLVICGCGASPNAWAQGVEVAIDDWNKIAEAKEAAHE